MLLPLLPPGPTQGSQAFLPLPVRNQQAPRRAAVCQAQGGRLAPDSSDSRFLPSGNPQARWIQTPQ